MQTKRNAFTTVRTEGALLPADLLRRIAEGDASVGGLASRDYHLTDGEKVNEAANRSWNRLLSAWRGFREARAKLPEGDPATSVTRDRWLLPLFSELGYGRLLAAKPLQVGERAYPISHAWAQTPIHLVGAGVELDRKTPGVTGAAKTSPHALVQECLNRSDEHLWGMVSNGLTLRLLRDNVSLVRQAYVEFDLQAMMEQEVYADFVLLWLVAHQSRVEADRPEACWLERWTRVASEQGTRALESLRTGVEAAIKALGSGFLAHRGSRRLRDDLRSGELTTQEYYRQLLRTVYRLIFLFVAEDRDFLFDPKAPEEARARYREFYSLDRLRELADRRQGTRHADLWHGVRLVFGMLKSDAGCPELGLPALNSFLWSLEATEDLIASEISNRDLLTAIRALAFTTAGGVRRPVDFRNLGSEELGSVYESLLELHPEVHAQAGTFALVTAGGNERKTTGSYYTPDSIIQQLLDSALDPVIEAAVRAAASPAEAEAALLRLKAIDLACGSGHFLVGAAHRLAKRLAAVRTGEEEPAPEEVRRALRDVIGRCIYGVDVNPMAVELCKVSLWMEALEPGKPLSFLDHHIQVGNALLGATPALIAHGLPGEAFEALEGDDKKLAAALKKRNKEELGGAIDLFGGDLSRWDSQRAIEQALVEVRDIRDDTVAGIHEKQRRYEGLLSSNAYQHSKLLADAWCAAFVWRKVPNGTPAITSDTLYQLRTNGGGLSSAQRDEVERLAREYQFFHWHLAFPEVFHVPAGDEVAANEAAGWTGGFDVVLGNPPWETLSPDAKEFFSTYAPEIRTQDRTGQAATIERLSADPHIAERWALHRRRLYGTVHFLKESGRYRMYAPGSLGKGDFNVYRMFVEAALTFTRPGGYAAQIVPEGLYNGANCMAIRQHLFTRCELQVLFGFENAREVWFEGIDSRTKFAVYAARVGGSTEEFRAAFNIRTLEHLARVRTGDGIRMPVDMVREFSPDALAVMEFQEQRQVEIAAKLYARWPKFGDESVGGPIRRYMAEIHMGGDRHLFTEDAGGIPVYEGRMVAQYDHRAKGYRSGRGRAATWEDLAFAAPGKSIQPQWYIPAENIPEKARDRSQQYRVGFCDVASPTNERTLVATLLPPGVIAGHSVPTFTFPQGHEAAYLVWLAVANSFVMDYVARMKVSLHMTFTTLDSLPFPRLPDDHPATRCLVQSVLSLTCTGPEMLPFWNLMAARGWVAKADAVPGAIDVDERDRLVAEIEALVAAELFGLTSDDVGFVLDSFPIVEREQRARHGEYRMKRLILAACDAVARHASSSAGGELVARRVAAGAA